MIYFSTTHIAIYYIFPQPILPYIIFFYNPYCHLLYFSTTHIFIYYIFLQPILPYIIFFYNPYCHIFASLCLCDSRTVQYRPNLRYPRLCRNLPSEHLLAHTCNRHSHFLRPFKQLDSAS